MKSYRRAALKTGNNAGLIMKEFAMEITGKELEECLGRNRKKCAVLALFLGVLAGVALAGGLYSGSQFAANLIVLSSLQTGWDVDSLAYLARAVECILFAFALVGVAAMLHDIGGDGVPFSRRQALRVQGAGLALMAAALAHLVIAELPKFLGASQDVVVVLGSEASDAGLLVAGIVLLCFGFFVRYGAMLQTISDDML